jgi:hypothetical protein
VSIATSIAGIAASWWLVAGQLLVTAVMLVSIKQDLQLRALIGAVFGLFMVIVFGISALFTAIRGNLRGGVWLCAVVLCFEILLIVRWILFRPNKTDSQ